MIVFVRLVTHHNQAKQLCLGLMLKKTKTKR